MECSHLMYRCGQNYYCIKCGYRYDYLLKRNPKFTDYCFIPEDILDNLSVVGMMNIQNDLYNNGIINDKTSNFDIVLYLRDTYVKKRKKY